MCRFSMTGDCLTEMCILKRGKKLRELLCASKNLLPAYLNFLKIKKAKFDDIKTLLAMSQFLTMSLFITHYQPNLTSSRKAILKRKSNKHFLITAEIINFLLLQTNLLNNFILNILFVSVIIVFIVFQVNSKYCKSNVKMSITW